MIPRKYEGRPVVLCATGPSLTDDVIETIREFKDKYVIFGVNDSYKVIDFLDEHYACDTKWWETWGADFKEKYPNLSSWTQCKTSAQKFNIQHIPGRHTQGFSPNSNLIHFGKNSGYQALNIAYLMGCKPFILTGYNMKPSGGKNHYFGDHPPGLNRNSPYAAFVKEYQRIQPAIAAWIINCTPDSALNFFYSADLRETLERDHNN